MSVAARVHEVRGRIAAAAGRVGRDADSVTLVAVAKSFGAHSVSEALDAGVRDIGESRAQELTRKLDAIGDRARWHFVGHLQRNKVRSVVGAVDLVHSLDRAELAAALGGRAAAVGTTVDVLIEVNVSGEASKHGCEPGMVEALAARVAETDAVELKGLMTMSPEAAAAEESRPYYRELAVLRDRLRRAHPNAVHLSMGMTRDFEVAVEEGATLVRVGEAIFGPRAS